MEHRDDVILPVQNMLAETDGQAINAREMSRHATLEERAFLRRFKSAPDGVFAEPAE